MTKGKTIPIREQPVVHAADLFEGLNELWVWILHHGDMNLPTGTQYAGLQQMFNALDEAGDYFDLDTEEDDEQAAIEQSPELRGRLEQLPEHTIVFLCNHADLRSTT